MTTNVNKYRFFCIEENGYVSQWGTVAPTICPNNHADKTIDLNSITIVEKIETNIIVTDDTSVGFFCVEQFVHNVPAGSPGDISIFDISWDTNITLWKTVFTPLTENIGDIVNVVAAPDTLIGYATAPITTGDTVISVSPTVLANLHKGFEFVINDGVNKHVTVALDIDLVLGTVTLKEASAFDYIPGSLLYLGVYLIKNMKIFNTYPISMGDKGLKGKDLLAGTKIRIFHTNGDGLAKVAVWRAEYYNNA